MRAIILAIERAIPVPVWPVIEGDAMTLSIGLVTLVVHHYDEAIAFFVDRLGFSVMQDDALEPGKRWVVVAPPGGKGPGLLLARAADAREAAAVGNQSGGRVGFFLMTDDFGRDHSVFEKRGVTFREAPRSEAYGKVAVFEDLYGNLWDLIEPRSA